MNRSNLCKALMAGASSSVLLMAPHAFAQTAPASTGLEEVVVTATRQVDTVNRVALSIAAVTQQALDQQGIKQAGDITRLVPGLNIVQTASTNAVGNFSIRGIVGGTGAATVGVYLDDTSLTKRSNNGINQNNGAPLPILFDLERVEVLKGPQGTLYGGSSEGGTIRFITPTPSLTKWSGDLRAEGKNVEGGQTGYEFGAAIGGPIVEDKLGFRISGVARRTPGYIDVYLPYANINGAQGTSLLQKDANGINENALRASVLWQATPRGSIQLSAYADNTRTDGGPNTTSEVFSKSANGQLASASETFTTPAVCVNTQTRNLVTQPILTNNPNAAPGTGANGVSVVPAACTASTPVAAQFNRPSLTYGPFPQGKNTSYLPTTGTQIFPQKSSFSTFSLTGNYNFDHVSLKSITSYLTDATYDYNYSAVDETAQQSIVGGPSFGTATTGGNPPGAVRGFPLWSVNPLYPGVFHGYTTRSGFEQELRASSPADERPISWVAGLFYSNQTINNFYYYPSNNDDVGEMQFFGITFPQRFGINNECNCDGYAKARLLDTEYAAFAEVNWWVTDKLKLNGGLRYSRLNFSYNQNNGGIFDSWFLNSATALGSGSATWTPVTPKASIEYQFTPNDLVYATAAKGFRAGGANQQLSQAVCQTALDQFGIKATDVPSSYQPDSVWSYELGSKLRLFDNKLQLNTALYRIDWTGVQTTVSLSCGLSFVENGGRARSQGVDFQGSYRPIPPLTLGLNVGYDNANYIDAVAGPKGPGIGPNSINAGDPFSIPPWQISTSAKYDFELFSRASYVRGDYQYQSGYVATGSYGVASYNPNTRNVPKFDVFNARAGMTFAGGYDINVYANNLFDFYNKIGNAGDGQTNCVVAAGPSCSQYGTFNPFVSQLYQRPREIGIQANYHF